MSKEKQLKAELLGLSKALYEAIRQNASSERIEHLKKMIEKIVAELKQC